MTALDIVFFGGTGDLCLRKLMPALYFLYRDGKLPMGSRILGLSRGHVSRTDYQHQVLEKLELYLGEKYDGEVGRTFAALLDYRELDIPDQKSWATLNDYLAPVGAREIIYYMAVPPTLFGTVCAQLKQHDLNPINSRLVVEKPLGEDEQSAEAVNDILSTSFEESQIYRIDHYLGKEAVQNILPFRFANRMMEVVWNRDHIDHVEITVAETVGVEGRASFLDRAGILRDMVQNHLMQVLCFVAMDAPKDGSADSIRDQKVRVVGALRPVTLDNIHDHVVRAQYGPGNAQPGYRQEIADQDITGTGETYVAVKALIDSERWQGVPFYLRTGKRLSARYAEVVVTFKAPESTAYAGAPANRITIGLQPDMTISCSMAMKQVLKSADDLGHHNFTADMLAGETVRTPDAYEKLLGDVMQGNQAYFVRHDEIIASWKWIDGIRKAWDAADLPLHSYEAGSMGPEASDALLAVDGHSWYSKEKEI
ncbi:glucose-6-phosphate dehydrogenase [Paremcibacter congregatus]|uniref:glucose-6-phosphate dehydrogenase n=1 Tax=Paremcibacter congregatus TaxID=2043170 RepID=UPI0030ECE1DA|tara:strand:+ start:1505 stop:2947 length:1443 start_codon:yes stop_codon:yes gene_type:complete